MNQNIKIKTKDIGFFLILIFLISISSFRLNYYIAVPSFLLVLLFSFIYDRKISFTKIFWWGLIFWGYYYLSLLWSYNRSDTLDYLPATIYIIGLLYFIPKFIKTEEDVNKIIKIVYLSLIFTAIYIILLTPLSSYGTERLGNVVGLNVNTIGFRMSLGALLSYHFIKQNKKNNKKSKRNMIFDSLFLVIFASLTLLSGSKKALIFILISIFIYEFIDSKGIRKISKPLLLLFIGGFVLYATLNITPLYNVIGSRVERLFLTITGNNTISNTDKSLIERRFYMNYAVNLFKEKPLIGYGGNTFRSYMRTISYSHVAYSHNNYTELLCTLGILGLVIYYSYWIKTLISLFKIVKNKIFEEKSIANLFFTTIVLILILDYGAVSYIVEFNIFLLCLFDAYIRIKNNSIEKGV